MPFTSTAMAVSFTCNARIAMVLVPFYCDILLEFFGVFGSVEEDVRARGVCSGRSGKNF